MTDRELMEALLAGKRVWAPSFHKPGHFIVLGRYGLEDETGTPVDFDEFIFSEDFEVFE